jgi:hypothetical protein
MRPAATLPAVRKSKAQLLQARRLKATFQTNPQRALAAIPLRARRSKVLHLRAHRLLSLLSPIRLSIAVSNKTRAKNRVNSRRIASFFLLSLGLASASIVTFDDDFGSLGFVLARGDSRTRTQSLPLIASDWASPMLAAHSSFEAV